MASGAAAAVLPRHVPRTWVLACPRGLVRARGADRDALSGAKVARFEDAPLSAGAATTRQCRIVRSGGGEWGFLADYVAGYRLLAEVLRRKGVGRDASPGPARAEAIEPDAAPDTGHTPDKLGARHPARPVPASSGVRPAQAEGYGLPCLLRRRCRSWRGPPALHPPLRPVADLAPPLPAVLRVGCPGAACSGRRAGRWTTSTWYSRSSTGRRCCRGGRRRPMMSHNGACNGGRPAPGRGSPSG
jgi:hypothetical protein